MPIKYAEITIVRNLKKESWSSYFKNLLEEEPKITNNDTIIILFDDGSICDSKDDLIDKQFIFGPKFFQRHYPLYFDKQNSKQTFFFKCPIIKDGILTIDGKTIFKDNPKYLTMKKIASIYNAICYIVPENHDVFAIVKKECNNRYLLAYDDSYFDKSDINYLVTMLFTNNENI